MNRIKAQRIKLAKEHQLNRKYVDKLRKVIRQARQAEDCANSLTFEDVRLRPYSTDRPKAPKLVGSPRPRSPASQSTNAEAIVTGVVFTVLFIAVAVVFTYG